jgi:hypothetical protein
MNINDLPSSRSEARALGFKHYFTGRPCSKGHLTKRHLTGTCVECGRAAVKRWDQRNPGEQARRSSEWQRNNPARAKERHQRWRHKKEGIPPATRPAPDKCENCKRIFKSSHDRHLDHDHITGKFRGWLCNRCNRGLGYFDDCIEGLLQAVSYLQLANASLAL